MYCIMLAKGRAAKCNVAPILLNGDPLPWVEKAKHLGNILQSDNSMKDDILAKRGKLIGKIHSIIQEFHYVDPSVLVKILNIHVTAFYGSSLWDLYSKEVIRIFSTWNVTMRHIFKLPRTTHRYFIEAVSGTPHPKTMLCTRLVKFLETVLTCSKGSVRYLASLVKDDHRTLMGRTISKISSDCNVARVSLVSNTVRTMSYFTPPIGEEWRIPLVTELIDVRDGKFSIQDIDPDEINFMLNEICTN